MRSALIDTNLFVLLVVGSVNKNYISSHKRTNDYTIEDYDVLMNNLNNYQELWVTSHCLAEVSNLLKQTDGKKKVELLEGLKFICLKANESHLRHTTIINDENYFRLGIADTGIVQKSKRVTCTFTVDFDLYLSISHLNRNVINFHHLRSHLLK